MALKNVPLFREINEEHLRYVAEHARFFTLEKDQFVFHKGDRCRGFYIVVQGNIKISFFSTEGKEHVARIVAPGQTFAEAITFLKMPSPASVQAMTPAKVLLLPSEVIFKCINDSPACAFSMLAGLSRRLHLLVTELKSVTLNSSKQRIIGFLLQHIQTAANKENKTQIMLEIDKSTIAAHLNIRAETLSRILHQLKAAGLISVYGRHIQIKDIEKLRSL